MTNTPSIEIPPVSIIIPVLNEEKYVSVLLDSLLAIRSPLDIIVVDGNSHDTTREIVKRYVRLFGGNSSLRLIELSERGISLQRNTGAMEAKHEILIFCDADVAAPTYLEFEKYVLLFLQKKCVAAVPILMPIERGKRIAFIHYLLRYMQLILLKFGKPYFGGAALTTTKEVFTRIGGFNTAILLAEDVDYSVRASAHGFCHQIPVKWGLSARRFIKYGYGWLLKEAPTILRLVVMGKVQNPEKVFYPFGEYSN